MILFYIVVEGDFRYVNVIGVVSFVFMGEKQMKVIWIFKYDVVGEVGFFEYVKNIIVLMFKMFEKVV